MSDNELSIFNSIEQYVLSNYFSDCSNAGWMTILRSQLSEFHQTDTPSREVCDLRQIAWHLAKIATMRVDRQRRELEHVIHRHGVDRLVTLSDGIFAMATTLTAIEIHLPGYGNDSRGFIDTLLSFIMICAISFAPIAWLWVHTRELLARITAVDQVMMRLALALLLGVALIPIMTHDVYPASENLPRLRCYLVMIAGCSWLNVAMWFYAVRQPGIIRADVTRAFKLRQLIKTAAMAMIITLMIGAIELAVWVQGPVGG